MSQLVQAVASAAPSVSPQIVTVTKTVVVDHASHLFQLAEIVKYVGLGAGLSLVHAVVNGRFGLPKALNRVLPLAYSVAVAVALLVVDGTLNWNDWYQVFVQVLLGAVGVYALVTAYNAASSSSSAPAIANLPVETAV